MKSDGATLSLSTVLYSAHADKETNKNSHLITQESSDFSAQESFGSLGNFVSGKKGGIKSLQVGKQIAKEEENESKAARDDLENVSNGLR
jgi:hypothetical protein